MTSNSSTSVFFSFGGGSGYISSIFFLISSGKSWNSLRRTSMPLIIRSSERRSWFSSCKVFRATKISCAEKRRVSLEFLQCSCTKCHKEIKLYGRSRHLLSTATSLCALPTILTSSSGSISPLPRLTFIAWNMVVTVTSVLAPVFFSTSQRDLAIMESFSPLVRAELM